MDKTIKPIICGFLIVLSGLIPGIVIPQSNNYWQRSFNEESSLLSGAVVGGGAGPSAIYYNPAGISEISQSKFTLNASLFSIDLNQGENALGDGIDLESFKGIIEPRFISYMINLKKFPAWSYEIAFLNNENSRLDLINSVDEQKNVLTQVPGNEKYYALFQYSNHFRDDWIGIGGSVKLNDRFFAGMATFVTIKSDEYTNLLNIEASSTNDSLFIGNEFISNYTATYQQYVYLKYNDYRLLFKGGLLYKFNNLSIGLNFTTPSVGVYSDGKRVTRSERRSNITDPETGEPMPDYAISDFKEKDEIEVSYKTPFSIAAGLTYKFPDQKRTLYSSMEYFNGVDPFRLIETEESPDLGNGLPADERIFSEWLTFVGGAKPVFNAALGYSWALSKNLFLMTGFRTDFNFQKKFNYQDYANLPKPQLIRLDLYHLTGGLAWNVFGQDIVTGLQYTFGNNKDQKQIVNLSDPVEYNTVENKPLQGTRNNNVQSHYNSFIIYFGASFNFGGNKEEK
ncbi:MAG: hypothetical protein JW833_17835 [Prolixibacteraceae bacterium]|nr:hypothetical protein [Prolixibacteraceae bacterium]